MSGFSAAWNAYLCALHGHAWTWTSDRTTPTPPVNAYCWRCGAEYKNRKG